MSNFVDTPLNFPQAVIFSLISHVFTNIHEKIKLDFLNIRSLGKHVVSYM